jgi:DNA-binding MarR family transcriptional regulator
MAQYLHDADDREPPIVTSSEANPERERVYELTREMRLMSSFDSLFSHAVAERTGMHSTDIETLDLLNVLGPMTAGQLSQMTGLSSGATTRLIDRLARAGLARRVSDPGDRRRVFIEPIEENLRAIGEMYMPLAEALRRKWASFSDEELTIILRFARESNAIVAGENARLRGQDHAPNYQSDLPNPGHAMPHPTSWH